MKNLWLVPLFVAVSGCNFVGGGSGDGGEGVAAVQPSRVTPEELRAAVSDPRLVRFYEARQWQPAWNATTARALVEAISQSPRHGLEPALFLTGPQQADAPAEREAALSLAALSYADALARGRVDPTRIREVYTLDRPEPDLAQPLNAALEGGDLAGWFDGLAPRDPEYRMLAQAYVAARQSAAQRRGQPIPEGSAIRPGASDPRIPAIAESLRGQGYLEGGAAPEGEAAPKQAKQGQPDGKAGGQGQAQQAQAGTRYTPELAAAVRRLQEDFGIDGDGVIDAETLAALNRGGMDRLRTLAVNLERRRWLPREAPPTRVDVNTAATMLTFWRDGRAADRRKVVAGQPGNETPELGSPMFRLVANPTWTVPESIAEEEILPKGPGYMARNNMTMRDGMIVQESGPDNALGEVKFDMRNDHAIYLHDTPAKALFGQEERHRSHGCVRVQDALGFARMIAEQEGILPQWERALATGEETFVALPREIPVRLLYHTAFVDEGGQLRFRPDVYGWDDDVAEALGLPARERGAQPGHVTDVGP